MGKNQVDFELRSETKCRDCWQIALLRASLCLMLLMTGCDWKPTPQAYEIDPQFQQEVNLLYTRFQKGKILYTRSISVLGHPTKVFIVDTLRGADYGFIQLPEKTSQFWVVRSGYYELKQYNATHLFVSIDDKYSNELYCNELDQHEQKDNEEEGQSTSPASPGKQPELKQGPS